MIIKQDGFYSYDEMMNAITALNKEHPMTMETKTLATSLEGREVPLIILSAPGTDHEKKPAYYIQANVHSNEGEGTTVCLYLMDRLCSDPQYQSLLEELSFYIVPRVNPDGTEKAVVQKYVPRSREIVHKIKDHIIPQDINGDGMILKIRIECPDGDMMPCEEDPRLMVPRTGKDAKGPFYKVYTEGLIHDWSGGDFYQPEKTTVDFNRNYPVYWQPENRLAGKYPFSEPEVKAVGEFLLSKPNIFAGMDIHNGSNAIFRPGTLPDEQYDSADLQLMKKVGEICGEITGFPFLVSGYRYETDPRLIGYGGTSCDFAHFMLGISFFTMELGNGFTQMGHKTVDFVMTKDFYKNNNKYVCELLKFHDERGTEFFYPWTEFNHPQLGKVEIGGITTANAYGISFPNTEVLPKAGDCLVNHAKMCPRLSLMDMKKERLEGNLYKISGYLTNSGIIPANGMIASKGRSPKSPVYIQCVAPEGGRIVGGMKEQITKADLKQDEKFYMEWFLLSEENKQWCISANHPRCIPAQTIL
ncbi:MAG TPA: hypothetical protein DDZ89_14220 [Clostridiales bacterium]|nr:hypothetical protein [Clostridiales bacterium]